MTSQGDSVLFVTVVSFAVILVSVTLFVTMRSRLNVGLRVSMGVRTVVDGVRSINISGSRFVGFDFGAEPALVGHVTHVTSWRRAGEHVHNQLNHIQIWRGFPAKSKQNQEQVPLTTVHIVQRVMTVLSPSVAFFRTTLFGAMFVGDFVAELVVTVTLSNVRRGENEQIHL
jgi:hypothetical protein